MDRSASSSTNLFDPRIKTVTVLPGLAIPVICIDNKLLYVTEYQIRCLVFKLRKSLQFKHTRTYYC